MKAEQLRISDEVDSGRDVYFRKWERRVSISLVHGIKNYHLYGDRPTLLKGSGGCSDTRRPIP